MKMIKRIGFVVLTLLLLLGLFMWFTSRPISEDQARSIIQKKLDETTDNSAAVSQALILVNKANERHIFTAGTLKGEAIDKDQPFHSASIGKTFTAVVIGQLVDDGLLELDSKITLFFTDEELEGLFVFEDKDYKNDVTVRMLLQHTSGVADYFEDPASGSLSLQELIIKDKDRFWTGQDLVNFTRVHQVAVGKPGHQYHYSDTGYILLGLLTEKVTGDSFGRVLNQRIFEPLGMENTYLMFYDHLDDQTLRKPIADVWLDGVNIKDYPSLSIDWAGGGLISTLEDMETFVVSTFEGDLLSQETLEEMNQYNYKFEDGIYYGLGLMELRFEEFFPLLGHLPRLRGHMGVLGTSMFYDPETKTTYISSFGSTDFTRENIVTMIEVLMTLDRIK